MPIQGADFYFLQYKTTLAHNMSLQGAMHPLVRNTLLQGVMHPRPHPKFGGSKQGELLPSILTVKWVQPTRTSMTRT